LGMCQREKKNRSKKTCARHFPDPMAGLSQHQEKTQKKKSKGDIKKRENKGHEIEVPSLGRFSKGSKTEIKGKFNTLSAAKVFPSGEERRKESLRGRRRVLNATKDGVCTSNANARHAGTYEGNQNRARKFLWARMGRRKKKKFKKE